MRSGFAVPLRDRCGEIIFSGETGENIRLMLNGDRKPTRSIQVDVFAFSV